MDPWLAGSPDGLVSDLCGDDTYEHIGLVEIKTHLVHKVKLRLKLQKNQHSV